MKGVHLLVFFMGLFVSIELQAIVGDIELHRDPFSRSKALRFLDENNNARGGDREVNQWAPKLLATIVAGEDSMVNLDGRIVRLGDTVNRYRLVDVSRYAATFKRDGQLRKIKLYIPVDAQ